MRLVQRTLPTVEENLALDQQLLDGAEADEFATGAGSAEFLRVWESPTFAIILGRASRPEELNLTECQARGIPVLRRSSGGTAVVIGPGCLLYSVVLSYTLRPALRAISEAHRFVLGRLAKAVSTLVPGVECAGTSDLAWHGRKVSGNSLRCRRDHFLYHGTLLYDFPIELIEACLRSPPRQPDYRRGRSHRDFVTNLPASREALVQALLNQWQESASRP